MSVSTALQPTGDPESAAWIVERVKLVTTRTSAGSSY
jgi:hypothetical protein